MVLPAYNAQTFIEEAVNSILGQSLPDFELIIINDGSSDGTGTLLERIGDPRLRVLTLPENSGTATAVSKGYGLASGEFIAHMDADDISEPDRLARQVAFLRRYPAVTVLGSAMTFFGEQTGRAAVPLTDAKIKSALLSGVGNIYNPTAMFRRRLVSEKGVRCEPSRKGVFDWDFWISALLAGAKFANLPEPLLRYRVHMKQQSRDLSSMYAIAGQVRERLLRVYFPTLGAAELAAIGPLLQRLNGPGLAREAVRAGLAAIDKALKYQKPSKFGEDRDDLQHFLRTRGAAWEKALAASS